MTSLFLVATSAHAGVTAERTRVIFEEGRREASLTLVNLNAYPVITQAWIDDGELNSGPNIAQAPILPLPPVFRLEPGEQRSLRLLATGQTMPHGRESLYWLNIYEVPPLLSNPSNAEQPKLTVTLRTQMKVLYRPGGLRPAREDAPSQLAFSREDQRLRVDNPTPYYITLARLTIDLSNHRITLPEAMLEPFSHQHLPLSAPLISRERSKVLFDWIDDSGAIQQGQTDLK